MAKKELKPRRRLLTSALIAVLAATVLTAGLSGCGGASKEDKATVDEVSVTESSAAENKDSSDVTKPGGEQTPAAVEPAINPKVVQNSGTANNNSGSGTANNNSGSAANNNANKSSSNNAGSNNAGSNSGSSNSGNSGSGSTNTGNGSGSSGTKSNAERKTTPSNAGAGKTSGKSKEDSAAKDLTIGGKTFKVGDKVVCTYFLEVPVDMVNFQGVVTYDSSMLKKTNAYLVEPASYSSLMNKDLDGRVVFNGSMLSGYDFTSPGYEFLVVEYEVLKTGTTEPSINFDVITGVNDTSYAGDNGGLTNGANVWAVYN